MRKLTFLFITLFSTLRITAGEGFCEIRNRAFQQGERINYVIFYNVLGMYVNAGNADFNANLERMGNKTVYHLVGNGSSNSSYDWIFKVRDKYESYIDTTNLQPFKFVRDVQEGDFKMYDNVTFNQQTNTAVSTKGITKVPPCIQDVLSAIYYARNINFEKYNVGDKIPFTMYLDNEVFDLYIKYLGKEKIKTKYGKFNAIKFKPLLIKGTIFEGGEKMNVWVSDDNNHIPLRVESPIAVGTIKVDMMGYRNLRYPLTSLTSVR